MSDKTPKWYNETKSNVEAKLKNTWATIKTVANKAAENVGSGMNESAKKSSMSGLYIDISKKGFKIKKTKE